MNTLTPSSIATLAIAVFGIVLGVVWFLIRPSLYKRELESASASSYWKLANPVKWGIVAIALSTSGLLFISLHSTFKPQSQSNAASDASGSKVISNGSNQQIKTSDKDISFTAEYKQFTKAHPRIWIQAADGSWIETYDGKTSNVFLSEGQISKDGCVGSLLKKRAEENFEVFLPMGTCSDGLFFRWKQGAWQLLGTITTRSEIVPNTSGGDTSW